MTTYERRSSYVVVNDPFNSTDVFAGIIIPFYVLLKWE